MKFLEVFQNWEELEEYDAGTVIFAEKDPADVMYVIISGEVELTLHGQPLGVEEAGGIVGEMAMISSATRSDTATVLSKAKLARLDREQFKASVDNNSEFVLHVMAVLANRLRAVNNYITDQFEQNR